MTSNLFLLDPDLIDHIAGLLQGNAAISDGIQAAALLAIDACAHLRARMPEVLTAVAAHVSHGPLMSIFRHIADNMDTGQHVRYFVCIDADFPVSPELVDAGFSLIAYIASSPSHVTMLTSAGVLPILLKVLGTKADRKDSVRSIRMMRCCMLTRQYVPRALGLIDSILYSNTQALPQFTNVDGVNTLVTSVNVCFMMNE